MFRRFAPAAIGLVLAATMAASQGIDLLGQSPDDDRNWRVACSYTARDKGYSGLAIGDCVVTQATHLPDATDHWVEIGRTWAFCVQWMRNAGVPGW